MPAVPRRATKIENSLFDHSYRISLECGHVITPNIRELQITSAMMRNVNVLVFGCEECGRAQPQLTDDMEAFWLACFGKL
jgi:hypothetical protein